MDERIHNRQARRAAAKSARGRGAEQYIADKAHMQYEFLTACAHEARAGRFEQIPFFKAAEQLSRRTFLHANEYESFSRRLIQEYCSGKSFQDAFHSLYSLIVILIAITKHAARQASPLTSDSEVSVLLIQSVFHTFSMKMFSTYSSKDHAWFASRVQSLPEGIAKQLFLELNESMYHFQMQIPFCRNIQKYMESFGISNEEALTLKQDTDRLFSEVKQLQGYSVQQSLFDDEMGLGSVHSWAVVDPRQSKGTEILSDHKRITWNYTQDYLVKFYALPDKGDIKEISSGIAQDDYSFISRLSFDTLLAYSYALADDGELYYQVYPVRIPMRDIFRQCGMEAQYEFLRFQFVARLFDLVVPREISEQTLSLDELGKRMRTAQNENPKAPAIKTIRDLITPRTRILKDKERMRSAFDIKTQREDGDSDEEMRRKNQFYGRVGHPMRLRQGYQPHPKANEWAKEDGFWRDLEPQETWCRTIDSPVPVVHRQKGQGNSPY